MAFVGHFYELCWQNICYWMMPNNQIQCASSTEVQKTVYSCGIKGADEQYSCCNQL